MAGNLPPNPNFDRGDQTEAIDPMEPRVPADIKTKLAQFTVPACAEIVRTAEDKRHDAITSVYPSGLLGTDDDRGLYRQGRHIHL